MKKSTLCIQIFLAATIVSQALLFADPVYQKFKSDKFNYEIVLPQSWEVATIDMTKKHIMNAVKNDTLDIKVRVYKTEESDYDRVVSKKSWDLRRIDPLLSKILETEKIKIKKNVRGKLLIFEYRSKRKKILQRTMISRNGDMIYIVDCKAPLRQFYRYETIFNVALSSFKYLTPSSDDEENKESDDTEEDEDVKDSSKKKSKADDQFFDLE